MPPYDKASQCESLIITDHHAIGLHSIHQEGQEQSFEIRLFPTPEGSKSKAQKTKSKFGGVSKMKKQKKNKSRGVRFDEQDQTRSIPHKSEFTPEQKALLWVNYHDWQSTQNERQRVSRAVLLGHLTIENQTEQLFLRGMECFIPQVAAKRREAVHFSRTLVLREQARAKFEERPLDHEHLAWCYASATHESKGNAYVQGLEDFYQVLEDDGVRRLSDIV